MKKLTALLLALMMVVLMAVPTFAAPKKGMLVLGDSIATGYGLPGYSAASPQLAADSFANKLAAKYKLTYGHTFYNFAIDGMTSAELASAVSEGKSQYLYKENALGVDEGTFSRYMMVDASSTQVAIKNCDTIVISIGGNDLLRPMFEIIMDYIEDNAALLKMMGIDLESMSGAGASGLSGIMGGANSTAMLTALTAIFTSEEAQAKFTDAVKAYSANIATILTSIYALNPGADVYLLCLYNPFDGVEMFASMAELTETFITAMAQSTAAVSASFAAKGFSAVPVQVKDSFDGKAMSLTNILAIDIHPNVQGHEVMYNALSAAIDAPKTSSAGAAVFAPSTLDVTIVLAAVSAAVSVIAVKSVKRRG